jgi:beta-D-xylosidase 4
LISTQVRDVLTAGTDVDCGEFVTRHASKALAEGLIDEALIDARLVNLFKVRLRLGHFDLSFDVQKPRGPLDMIPESVVCSKAHVQTSYEGVAQSATLYKNDGALPLRRVETLLVSGPTANISQVLASYYGPRDVCGGAYPGLVDAVRDAGRVDVVYEQDLEKVVAAASTVDAVVLALGTDLNYAREGRDAPSIKLPADQLQLVEEVAAAARKPITVVLLTATPLDISQLMANVKIGAVAHLGQPSVAVVGFSDLLYGRRSFAGRAVQTVYPAAYEDQISIADFNMRPGPSVFARPDCAMKNASRCPRGVNPGRTYRFYEGKAVVPFGFGLSYTSFRYALRVVGATSFVVDVTNIGSMAADDVVLLFLVPPNVGADGVALKDLVAFDRVHVPVNATVSVALSVPPDVFAAKGAYTVEAGVRGDARVGFDAATVFVRGDGVVV